MVYILLADTCPPSTYWYFQVSCRRLAYQHVPPVLEVSGGPPNRSPGVSLTPGDQLIGFSHQNQHCRIIKSGSIPGELSYRVINGLEKVLR